MVTKCLHRNWHPVKEKALTCIGHGEHQSCWMRQNPWIGSRSSPRAEPSLTSTHHAAIIDTSNSRESCQRQFQNPFLPNRRPTAAKESRTAGLPSPPASTAARPFLDTVALVVGKKKNLGMAALSTSSFLDSGFSLTPEFDLNSHTVSFPRSMRARHSANKPAVAWSRDLEFSVPRVTRTLRPVGPAILLGRGACLLPGEGGVYVRILHEHVPIPRHPPIRDFLAAALSALFGLGGLRSAFHRRQRHLQPRVPRPNIKNLCADNGRV